MPKEADVSQRSMGGICKVIGDGAAHATPGCRIGDEAVDVDGMMAKEGVPLALTPLNQGGQFRDV
ncbi:hypothetical protein D3C85_1934350 [compost metagenome]